MTAPALAGQQGRAYFGTRRPSWSPPAGEVTWRCLTCRGPVDGHAERGGCVEDEERLGESVERLAARGIGW